ncbi:MAG: response regulator transcription factor [Deltaproteobacteria bacterium]|nr:response regulator transcription factor [Deltaproteobacteria bacterium]
MSLNKPIRIIIVDDHTIVRKGLVALFEEVDDIEVVGEGATGHDTIDLANKFRPDVILTDLRMPEMDGLTAIQLLLEQQSDAKILILTSLTTDDKLFPSLKAGAKGYMIKHSNPEELMMAVRRIHNGEAVLHPSIAHKVLNEFSKNFGDVNDKNELTRRETDVLRYLAKGFTNQQIADELGIASVTVRTHVSHILEKIQAVNRVQATLYALRTGITSLEKE